MATKITKAYKLYKDFVSVEFESSTVNTKEFNSFATKLKNAIKEQLQIAGDWELIKWNKGHFECSGFAKNATTGKIYYISISDVRFFKNEWFENVLIRTAEHDKDYKGGMNQFCRLDKINEYLV